MSGPLTRAPPCTPSLSRPAARNRPRRRPGTRPPWPALAPWRRPPGGKRCESSVRGSRAGGAKRRDLLEISCHAPTRNHSSCMAQETVDHMNGSDCLTVELRWIWPFICPVHTSDCHINTIQALLGQEAFTPFRPHTWQPMTPLCIMTSSLRADTTSGHTLRRNRRASMIA